MFASLLFLVSKVFCSRSSRCLVAALCAGLVLSGVPKKATAQTAHFSGAQTYVNGGGVNIFSIAVDGKGDVFFTVQNGNTQGGGGGSTLCAQFAESSSTWILNGFTLPTGLAVDSSGNLYILDSGAGKIDEIAATNGSIPETASPTVISVATGINSTGDLVIDNHGDIFFTSVSASAVEELVAVNGVIPPSPIAKAIGSGFRFPVGITVDPSGNLFVGDTFNNAVKEVLAVNGSIPASPTIVTLGSGFLEPEGLSIDKSGNLYVSDYGNNTLKQIKAVNGAIPPSPTVVNLGPYSGTQAVAVDSNNLLYVGDTGNNSGGSVFRVSLTGGTFAQTNVGSSSQTPISMAFTFDTAGTLGSVSVVTQGAAGLDFVDAGSGSCKANTAYSSGQTCTVNAQFMPKFAGARIGAVVLNDSTGNVIATGYVQGSGAGPQVSFLPGTETVIPGPSVSNPHGIAVDGKGNIYVSDDNGIEKETFSNGGYTQTTIATGSSSFNLLAVDGAGSLYITDLHKAVLKVTPVASGYSQTVVDSGFGYPYGVAVDGAGNVYIADAYNGQILKETPSAGGYTRSVVVSGLTNCVAVAVDGNGNLYIASDGYSGSGTVVKETLSASGYTATELPIEGAEPYSVIVDGTGNVYFTDSQTYNVYKETPTPSGYVESTVVTDLHDILGPYGLAVDGSGRMYIAYLGGNLIVKADFADPPMLNFASTPVGTTSADSPQTVTLTNIGNADLTFPIPASGTNPSITTNFTLDENAPSACPVTGSGFGTAGVLAAGTSCVFPISFAPTATGNLSGSLLLTDNNLNTPGPAYATQSISLSGTGALTTPTITWPSPAAITYGTALSGTQLDATASVPGSFSYSPAQGTVLSAGTQSLNVTFTPTDTTDYATAYATVQLTVNTATPILTWPAPAAITYGTVLSSAQLNATANVPGTFAYSPAQGTVPSVGSQTLTVIFTPTDTTDYATVNATVQLTVNKAAPTITWAAPAAITYGTALSGAQLNATANVPGTFSYSAGVGTVLTAGVHALNVTFTPTDTTDNTTASATVQLTVNKATPVLSWPTPAAITYGTALSGAQLNATANVPGTFVYSPAAGTVLPAGTNNLNVTFTPTDGTDYNNASASVSLIVNAPDFSISAAPASVSVKQGGKVSSTITVSPSGGFSSTVALSASGLPKGVSAAFSPSSTKTTGTVTFSVSNSASLATTSITITGKAGSLTKTTTISLTVNHK